VVSPLLPGAKPTDEEAHFIFLQGEEHVQPMSGSCRVPSLQEQLELEIHVADDEIKCLCYK
jgi:hypothetical protein